MKFNSHFQAERLMDTIQANTQTFFTVNEVNAGKDDDESPPVALDSMIKHYIRTGKYVTPDTENKNKNDLLD